MIDKLLRFFGIGGIPRDQRALYESEGVVVLDEGVRGSVTYRNFRAPGRRAGWKRQWFRGALVLTYQRFVAYAFGQRVIDLPLTDPRLHHLHCWTDDGDHLRLAFEASAFHENQSGSVDLRCTTVHALELSRRLRNHGAAEGPPPAL